MFCLRIVLLAFLVNQSVFSDEIKIVGTIEYPLILPQAVKAHASQSEFKLLSLLEFELAPEAQNAVYHRVLEITRDHNMTSSLTQSLPARVQLGMNKVPVLDQGQFGTCAIFAVTGAIDALLKKGDYVSQLCLLQLGQSLEEHGQGGSGWSGSSATIVLGRIQTYGIVNMKNQKTYGCGGAMQYPATHIPSSGMSEDEYRDHSETVSNHGLNWTVIRRKDQVSSDVDQMNQFVNSVKAAVQSGHRLVVSVLFPMVDASTIGASGWHHYFGDTWVITSDMAKKINYNSKMAGHMMIITGFDDEAVAMDAYGHRHHGLFTLRNSWGANAGDWGDYYMSYDFFKALAVTAYQISIAS